MDNHESNGREVQKFRTAKQLEKEKESLIRKAETSPDKNLRAFYRGRLAVIEEILNKLK